MNQAVILAGGQGKRMKAPIPKPMFQVLGEPMLEWVLSACEKGGLERICVVTGYESEQICSYLGDRCATAYQAERLGTGHAVMQTIPFLNEGANGNTLVLCGDAPFIDAATISKSLERHIKENNAVTVITAEVADPTGYGRILRTDSGIAGIVEEKDATDEQRAIREINSGCYWFRTSDLIGLLGRITNNNKQGEYYLTDTIAIALESGLRAGAFRSDNPDVVLGANDRKGLLRLNEAARMRKLNDLMDEGIGIVCTDGIIIERHVQIGKGTELLPGTIIRGNTVIGENCKIGPNCVIENTVIGDNVTLNTVQAYDSTIDSDVRIGPYVHIRPNSHICPKAKIGDFVEIKNSEIGEGTMIAHLAYLGDSDIGKHVNIGCGTVTVNFDGLKKSRCEIGDHAFIGCNNNLIAPVSLGKDCYTAAGATITTDVPDYALAIDRGTLHIKEGYTLRKFAKHRDENKDETKE
ncbi:MAG: bifunctional UDP-N-acetylglucosamine diphosphorylase/glucosamine-1-phosphate N-acetyltransferase GlmU [Oscillospiraceae bacterium]|nr:bifunctional UDP-N-acetylglucosamine diphosphorylase/glucosamine-1-phosphate N-acetyltransferase GlmU [Oscillospiraceae bacterium]